MGPMSRPTGVESYASLLRRRLDRRDFLGATLGCFGAALIGPQAKPSSALGFTSLAGTREDVLEVPEGYRAEVLLSWGQPICKGAGEFRLEEQSGASQSLQFGFNPDFSACFPLEGSSGNRGLLVVNHEYPGPNEMFPGYERARLTPSQVEVQMAACGLSVVEVQRTKDGWRVVSDSRYNRRITSSTAMDLAGPVRGDALVRTALDAGGHEVLGTFANCGGGKTPWGTVLSCEENFHEYFARASVPKGERLQEGFRRYGMLDASLYGWDTHVPRFDLSEHPQEAHRFGWVVEVDPFAPGSKPKKRTALGRMRHEGATPVLADDGRVVVYMGDDGHFEYLYKFVSAGRFDPEGGESNGELLDRGTLFVARFHLDGTGDWLPLIPEGPLEGWSPARILVHARAAADRLGATPMDRPEDVEVNPVNQRVYVCMTMNPARLKGDGGPNPRASNRHGHVLELSEFGGDFAARRFQWSPFMLAGPEGEGQGGQYGRGGKAEPLSCPDNIAFDGVGNLWIATDGQPSALGINDSIYAVPTAGPERARPRRFLNGPIGCEICGPEFTPDFRTLFVCVQHPGAGGGLESPRSRWPHDGSGLPRGSLVAVTGSDGRPVGS